MSFNFDQLGLIGQQLLYNYPQVYDFHIPDNLKMKYGTVLDNLVKVVSGGHVTQAPWSNLNILKAFEFLSKMIQDCCIVKQV